MGALVRALRYRPFALLWGGQSLSRFGDEVNTVVLAWWVIQATGSATALGGVLVARFLPMAALSLLGGVAVDRLPRAALLLGCDLIRGAAMLAVAGADAAGVLTVEWLAAAIVVYGLVNAVFYPAYLSLIPQLVPAQDLTSANALRSLTDQGARITGPAVAGAVLFATGSTALGFGVHGVTLLVAAVAALPLLGLRTAPPATGGRGVLGQLNEGFRYVLATPWLWVSIGLASIQGITQEAPVLVALPIHAAEAFGLGALGLGLVQSARGVGSTLAAFWFGSRVRLPRRGLLLYGAWALSGASLILVAAPWLPVALIGGLILGATFTTVILVWNLLRQQLVPEGLQGRVIAVDFAGSFALQPLGLAGAGLLSDSLGAAPALALGGAVSTVLVLTGLLHPQVRRLP